MCRINPVRANTIVESLLPLSPMKMIYDIDLAPYNSFGVSVRAARFAEVASAEDAAELFALPEVEKWMALGDGCNVLFTGDYDGTIVRIADTSIVVESEDDARAVVRVGGGVEWDDFVEWSVCRELWGPGTADPWFRQSARWHPAGPPLPRHLPGGRNRHSW